MFPHDYSWKLMIRGREETRVFDANDLSRLMFQTNKKHDACFGDK